MTLQFPSQLGCLLRRFQINASCPSHPRCQLNPDHLLANNWQCNIPHSWWFPIEQGEFSAIHWRSPWGLQMFAISFWDGWLNLQWGARERHSPLLPKLLSWEDAISKAEATLKLMSQEQKTSLLQGTGWEPTKWWFDLPKYFYVGNTPAMPEIGLPSLNMQDATDGFRTYWTELSGTITVWPSILAMAATQNGDFRHFPQQDSFFWPIPGRVMGEKRLLGILFPIFGV